MIELTLPYPPSVNHYKTMGRLKTSKAGNMYREMVNSPQTLQFYCDVMNISLKKSARGLIDSTISLEVYIGLHPPDKRRADIDNRIKVTLDSLVRAQVLPDDSKISRLVVERCSIIPNGSITVRISPYEPPATERP